MEAKTEALPSLDALRSTTRTAKRKREEDLEALAQELVPAVLPSIGRVLQAQAEMGNDAATITIAAEEIRFSLNYDELKACFTSIKNTLRNTYGTGNVTAICDPSSSRLKFDVEWRESE